jgi:hypothetical protein
MAGTGLKPIAVTDDRERIPGITDAGTIFDQLRKVVEAIGKYGVSTVIFALPTVIGCFGIYFLWIAVNAAEASTAKISVGIFATVFGSGLTILLLYMFTRMNLWERLGLSKMSQDQQKTISILEARIRVLEERTSKAVA